MKLLMDADCLIKFTKAGLKDLIGSKNDIFIPQIVQREIVDAGKEKKCPDAFIVESNIEGGMIMIVENSSRCLKGNDALVNLFRKEKYDAVATDDAKLTRLLRASAIPFILPGLIIYQILHDGIIERKTALWALQQLAEFISEDEYSMVRFLMERVK